MFFYPKDNTPGCTLEAKAFSDNIKKFQNLGINVFGVSGNKEDSHVNFINKHCLLMELIDDTDFLISKKYGFFAKKSLFGFKYDAITRSTIYIKKNRKIGKIWHDVSVFSHINEVLNFLEQGK